MKTLLAFAFLMITASPALADDYQWKPVNPAHLALKAPTVEPDADAEIIFWEVSVDLDSKHPTFLNYICIKIFTERGKELHSKVDLPYLNKNKIEDIAARTIKANGTIIELNAASVFERVIIKASGVKLKAKSFALPAVEIGDVIEYRWREMRDAEFFYRLPCQRSLPIQSVKYLLKTPSSPYKNLRVKTFNGQNTPFVREKDNLVTMTMTNVPAFREEPDMPPENQVRTWVLAYFTSYGLGATLNRFYYDDFKSSTKLNGDLRKTATAIVGDATTAESKLRRLFEFCQTKIKNADTAASGVGDAEREKLKDDKTAADTLKRGAGTGQQVNILFAALAQAAGFDARLAVVCDRSDFFFEPRNADTLLQLYFMRSSNIAVSIDSKWRFFDPSSAYVPYGMLRWQEEGLNAIIIGTVFEEIELTPLSPAEKSLQKRTAKLRLSEDGTLEGDVRIEYSGHSAVERRIYGEEDSPSERERLLGERIKAQMSTAELSDVRIENVTDPAKPLVYAFHVRVPGYAQRTGKRLFLQPAFFQRGLAPRFPASERKHGVYFHYPWSEKDNIDIELPAGYELDNAESIGSIPLGGVGKYEVDIGITKDKRILVYERRFVFGANGRMFFPPDIYPQLKRIYDATHELDNHTITLKQSATSQPR
jgi:Domain of Unknown Function with PDB structure (DUF3857)/Transglutaminase-like superfamily